MIQTTQLITTQQAADMLCLQRGTLEKWRIRGIGPKFVRLTKAAVRYRVADLEQFIEKQLADSPMIEA